MPENMTLSSNDAFKKMGVSVEDRHTQCTDQDSNQG